MTANTVSLREMDLDSGIDPNASPLDSIGISSTPNTELSPPESPFEGFKGNREAAQAKLSKLTQEEKVYRHHDPLGHVDWLC